MQIYNHQPVLQFPWNNFYIPYIFSVFLLTTIKSIAISHSPGPGVGNPRLRSRMRLFCPSTAALAPIFEAGEGVLILEILPLIIGEDLFFLFFFIFFRKHLR